MKLLIVLLIFLLLIAGCKDEETIRQENYRKCTSVCAATIVTEDYITLHLCNEQCREEFLNSSL